MTTKTFEVIFVQDKNTATKYFDTLEECVKAAAIVRAKFGKVSVTVVEHICEEAKLLAEVVDGKVPFKKAASWKTIG